MMTTANRLEGKVALITGAGSGIGRESAVLFARQGASVVAVDVDISAARDTVTALEHGRGVAVAADVSKAGDCEAMIAAAEQEFGRVHVIFQRRHHAPGRW